MNFVEENAEHAVLAGICCYGGDVYIDVCDLLGPESFSDEIRAAIYKSIQHHYKLSFESKIDYLSILSASQAVGMFHLLDQPDSKKYIRALFNIPIEKDTARREAGKLFKLQVLQQLDEISAQSRRDFRKCNGDESINDILSIIEKPLLDYSAKINSPNDGPIQIADGGITWLKDLKENPIENIGIPTPFPIYNTVIGGGYRRGTVNIVAARPKTGKSMFCDNIALHVAGTLGIPVFNLDTEMTQEEHLARILAHLTNIPIRDIEHGWITDSQCDLLNEKMKWLESIPYYYESVVAKSFPEHISTMRRWMMKHVGTDNLGVTKDALIIYDYLQLMDVDGLQNMKEYQALGFQMLSLLQIAARHSVPILSLLQTNRDGIDQETTAVASGSDRIVWKCANFTLLKRKDEEELAQDGVDNGNLKLVPIVARHGEMLNQRDYINILFEGKTAKMVEGKTRNELTRTKKTIASNQTFDMDMPDGTNETVEF